MRILYHHRTLGDGAEGIHVREMVRAFRALGHQVVVIGPTGEAELSQSRKSKWLYRLKRGLPAVVFEVLEIAYSLYAYWKTTREIRRFAPDFVYERYITFNIGTTLAARHRGVPVCLEVNAPLALERSGEADERLIFRRLATWMERWVCSHATHTIVVSTPLKTYLESIGVPNGKCIVMPNGVDPVRFAPRASCDGVLRQRLGLPADHVVIGFTGVLRPWHGIELLLDALAGVLQQGEKVVLLIVGDGPHRPRIEQRVRELGLEGSVFITGRVRHDAVPDYVALFDIAVSPRATFYASPMKVIEYMALAKPVVVPRTPNFLDIIDEDLTGVTFADAVAEDLAAALVRLCRSPELRRTIGAGARRKVESRLNWSWNAAEVCRLIAG